MIAELSTGGMSDKARGCVWMPDGQQRGAAAPPLLLGSNHALNPKRLYGGMQLATQLEQVLALLVALANPL